MKERNKHWLKLAMQITALALLALAVIFIWRVSEADNSSTPIGQKLEFKIIMIMAVLALYQIYRTAKWLIIYYHFNPDRAPALIPGGFKGFHHKTSQDILKILNETYEDYYIDKHVLSVKKVALWRSGGCQRFKISMLSGQRDWQTVYARHFLLCVEVVYQDIEEPGLQTDYYHFGNGNLMTSPNSYSLTLPFDWKIKEDVIGQIAE
ncbi:MAG: hypothetical protein WC441_01375 [Patescibacteria group bacterium]